MNDARHNSKERVRVTGSIANTRICFEVRAHSSTSPPSHRRIFNPLVHTGLPHRKPPLRIWGKYNREYTTLIRLPIKNHVIPTLFTHASNDIFILRRIKQFLVITYAWVKSVRIMWFLIGSLIRVCRSRWMVQIIHGGFVSSHEALVSLVLTEIFSYIYKWEICIWDII